MTFACLTIIQTDVGEHLSSSSVLEQKPKKFIWPDCSFWPSWTEKGVNDIRKDGGKKKDGNKFVQGRGTGSFQVQQVRTNYRIRPTVAKYLAELLCGLLLLHPPAKAQAALTSASKSTDHTRKEESQKKATIHSSLHAVTDSRQVLLHCTAAPPV